MCLKTRRKTLSGPCLLTRGLSVELQIRRRSTLDSANIGHASIHCVDTSITSDDAFIDALLSSGSVFL